jgi:hypothetical protein
MMSERQAAASGMKAWVLRTYVLAVDLGAIAVLALLPRMELAERATAMMLLAVLAALAGAFPVRIPVLRVNMTAVHPFVLCALAAVGPLAAVLVSVIGVLGAAVGRRCPPQTLHLVFNLGAAVLGSGAAWSAYQVLGGEVGGSPTAAILPLTVATVVYFLASSVLVAMAIALERGQAFLATWQGSCLWTAVAFLSGLTFAVAMLVVIDTLFPWVALLGLPPCWLLVAYYRNHTP